MDCPNCGHDLNSPSNEPCPACDGTGKANVNETGDIQENNPDNLDCGWCCGTGLANQ